MGLSNRKRATPPERPRKRRDYTNTIEDSVFKHRGKTTQQKIKQTKRECEPELHV